MSDAPKKTRSLAAIEKDLVEAVKEHKRTYLRIGSLLIEASAFSAASDVQGGWAILADIAMSSKNGPLPKPA